MRIAIAWLGGIVVGLIASVPARRAVIHYSEHSLPTPYPGPRFRFWEHGVEVVPTS